MAQSSIEKHELKKGELSYSATPKTPLTFYTGKAVARGILYMGPENEGKEFIIIPVD